jgi:hypothetical protein
MSVFVESERPIGMGGNTTTASSNSQREADAMNSRHEPRRGWLLRWRALLFWVLFVSGLLVEAWGPRMTIKDNQFIAPPLVAGSDFNPLEAVARERRVRLLSATLTLSGTIGLAFSYRGVLFGRRSAGTDLVNGGNPASSHSRI